MAEPVRETIEGDGYTVGHIDGLGEGWGFRKVRKGLGVSAFGVNAVVMPPNYAAGRHAQRVRARRGRPRAGRRGDGPAYPKPGRRRRRSTCARVAPTATSAATACRSRTTIRVPPRRAEPGVYERAFPVLGIG